MLPSPSPIEPQVWSALQSVYDPELAVISVVDLGLIKSVTVQPGGVVEIVARPTFSGCPALETIATQLVDQVEAIPGVTHVNFQWSMEGTWSLDALSNEAKSRLVQESGIAVPSAGPDVQVLCPYCGADNVAILSDFGPTQCRSVWYCEDCKNPFEALKPKVPTGGARP